MTTILEAIEQVKDTGAHKNQYKYDIPRSGIYELAAVHMGLLKPKSVLDVGCAYGTMSYIAKKMKYKVTALDCMPELHNEKLFKGIDFKKVNVETDTISGKYDAILLMDVLEHFNYNPLPVLKKLRKVCQKGLILSTPAREFDPVMPETAKYRDYINWKMIPELQGKYDFVDSHHHTYTLWELKTLLKEAGFKVAYSQLMPNEATWFIRAEV